MCFVVFFGQDRHQEYLQVAFFFHLQPNPTQHNSTTTNRRDSTPLCSHIPRRCTSPLRYPLTQTLPPHRFNLYRCVEPTPTGQASSTFHPLDHATQPYQISKKGTKRNRACQSLTLSYLLIAYENLLGSRLFGVTSDFKIFNKVRISSLETWSKGPFVFLH